jgi:hypothetical protein
MIEKSQKIGELRSDVSAKTLAYIVYTLLERIDLLVSFEQGDEVIMAGIDELLDVIKHGIFAK